MTAPTFAVTGADQIELSLLLVGAVVFWRAQFSKATAAQRHAPALPAWPVTQVQFLAMAFCVVMGAMLSLSCASIPADRLPHILTADAELWNIIRNSSLQFGLLVGILVARLLPLAAAPVAAPAPSRFRLWPAAIATFLIALFASTVIGYAAKLILPWFGVSVAQQDLIGSLRDTHSRPALIVFILAATILAPLTEELVFRAGLFRYLRLRVPRWLALLLPAALFASLHGNALAFLPLMALAVVFSIAYERTGRISVTIVAHGLFNLHTILLILAGVTQ